MHSQSISDPVFDASASAAIVKVLVHLLVLFALFIFSNRSHFFVRRTEIRFL